MVETLVVQLQAAPLFTAQEPLVDVSAQIDIKFGVSGRSDLAVEVDIDIGTLDLLLKHVGSYLSDPLWYTPHDKKNAVVLGDQGGGREGSNSRGEGSNSASPRQISYWARKVCGRLLQHIARQYIDLAVPVDKAHILTHGLPASSLSRILSVDNVLQALESVFENYLEAFIISSKLLPLHAASELLCCEHGLAKDKVLAYLDEGVPSRVCRILLLRKDLPQNVAREVNSTFGTQKGIFTFKHNAPPVSFLLSFSVYISNFFVE